jgi:hypothetical protein
MYMNPHTGSVDTRSGWDYEHHKTKKMVNAADRGEVVPVKKHKKGHWVEADEHDGFKRGGSKHVGGFARGGSSKMQECPECGGNGYTDASEFGDHGYHACYACGTSGSVPENKMGESRRSVQKRDRREAANKEMMVRAKSKKAASIHNDYSGGDDIPFKRGGTAKHDDTAEDTKLIKKLVKKDAIKSGMKHGGSTHPKDCMCKACGGSAGYKRGGPASVSDGAMESTRPTGGRMARKHGGSAGKGKMNVNIIIGAGHKDGMGPPHQGGMPPSPAGNPMAIPPNGLPPSGPPLGAGGPPPNGPPMPPPPSAGGPPPMMGRKTGGRVAMYAPKQHGAGGGLGRLQKLKAYGANAGHVTGHKQK